MKNKLSILEIVAIIIASICGIGIGGLYLLLMFWNPVAVCLMLLNYMLIALIAIYILNYGVPYFVYTAEERLIKIKDDVLKKISK